MTLRTLSLGDVCDPTDKAEYNPMACVAQGGSTGSCAFGVDANGNCLSAQQTYVPQINWWYVAAAGGVVLLALMGGKR